MLDRYSVLKRAFQFHGTALVSIRASVRAHLREVALRQLVQIPVVLQDPFVSAVSLGLLPAVQYLHGLRLPVQGLFVEGAAAPELRNLVQAGISERKTKLFGNPAAIVPVDEPVVKADNDQVVERGSSPGSYAEMVPVVAQQDVPFVHQFPGGPALDHVVGLAGAAGQPVTEPTDNQHRLEFIRLRDQRTQIPAFIVPVVKAETLEVQSDILRVLAITGDGMRFDEAQQPAVDGPGMRVVVVSDVAMLLANPIEHAMVSAAVSGENDK